jgi:hypothetical protein
VTRIATTVTFLIAGLLLVAGCDPDESEVSEDVQVSDHVIYSSDYLNHRFFRLDLPLQEIPNGRVQGDEILLESIRIFQLLPGQPDVGDVANVAAYVDSLGFGTWWEGIDFNKPHLFGSRWREFEVSSWDPLLDADGKLIAVDLRTPMADEDILAVVYEIKLANGSIVPVGDFPGLDEPVQLVEGGEGYYYRMKLLKAPVSDQEAFTFQYVLRNIYSLGAANLDFGTFDLRIERNVPAGAGSPHLDENGLDYIRIFGLDRDDSQGSGNPDGMVDLWDPFLFDLQRGLLKFPQDFPMPFAPGGNPNGRWEEAGAIAEATYAAYADTSAFVWDLSFLQYNQTWQLYDPVIYPPEYPQFARFRIIATYLSETTSIKRGISNTLGIPAR